MPHGSRRLPRISVATCLLLCDAAQPIKFPEDALLPLLKFPLG
jgi:hypothetical protein